MRTTGGEEVSMLPWFPTSDLVRNLWGQDPLKSLTLSLKLPSWSTARQGDEFWSWKSADTGWHPGVATYQLSNFNISAGLSTLRRSFSFWKWDQIVSCENNCNYAYGNWYRLSTKQVLAAAISRHKCHKLCIQADVGSNHNSVSPLSRSYPDHLILTLSFLIYKQG